MYVYPGGSGVARHKGRNNNDQKEPQANKRVHSSYEQSEDKTCYRVYGSWMAENFQDQVSILNQKLSEFAPSMPHAVGSDIINKHSQQVTKPTPAWTSLPDTPPPAYYAPESPFA